MQGATNIRHVVDHKKLKAMADDWNAKYGGTPNPLDQEGAVYTPTTDDDEAAGYLAASIRAELASIGFQKATKRELQAVILNAIRRDEER
jgi:hypothetical protein